MFSGVFVELAEAVGLENIAIVTSLAFRFSLVFVAAFDVARFDADVQGVSHKALFAVESHSSNQE